MYWMAMAPPSEPDWAGLPKHLLDLISDKLDSLSYYVRFGAVCISWRSIAIHNQKKQQWQNRTCNSHPPLLMIPTKDSSEKMRSLYRVTDGKIYNYQLPIPYNMRCCGSSHGWLVFFDQTVAPILFNPFLNDKNNSIHLPSLDIKHYGDMTIKKVVLSANPALEQDYVVVAIYGLCRLAFMKAGDKSWTCVSIDKPAFQDVIFYRDRILAVDQHRMIVSVQVFNKNQVTIIAPNLVGIMEFVGHTYLVESLAGELLTVEKIYDDDEEEEQELVKRFDVYKLVLDNQTGMVVNRNRIKSLGEESLFLGCNHSMSILASKHRGLEENSVYYTDDYMFYERGFYDSGIFSLEDGTIQPHYLTNPSQNCMPSPIWIVPTLQEIRMELPTFQ